MWLFFWRHGRIILWVWIQSKMRFRSIGWLSFSIRLALCDLLRIAFSITQATGWTVGPETTRYLQQWKCWKWSFQRRDLPTVALVGHAVQWEGKQISIHPSTVTQLMVARWRCRTQRVTDQREDLKHWTEPEDKKSCDTSFNHRCWTCEERLHNICMHVNQNVRHLLMLHRGKAQFSNWMQTQNVWHCCAKMHDELNSDWITEKCCFI